MDGWRLWAGLTRRYLGGKSTRVCRLGVRYLEEAMILELAFMQSSQWKSKGIFSCPLLSYSVHKYEIAKLTLMLRLTSQHGPIISCTFVVCVATPWDRCSDKTWLELQENCSLYVLFACPCACYFWACLFLVVPSEGVLVIFVSAISQE